MDPTWYKNADVWVNVIQDGSQVLLVQHQKVGGSTF